MKKSRKGGGILNILPRANGFARTEQAAIKELIEDERIVTHFQPIHSVQTRTILGVEALSRGVNPSDASPIAPARLIEESRSAGLWLAMERLMRRTSLETFRTHFGDQNNSMLLFLNFDPAVFDEGVAGSGHLSRLVASLGINPSRVALEIIESRVSDTKLLLEFVERHRALGFLIAVDDVGDGESNLARMALLKPNILKIDRSLCSQLARDYYCRKAVQSLIWFAHQVGALALAEGLETREESLIAMELGADLLQGYYLGRPTGDMDLLLAQRSLTHDLMGEHQDRTTRRVESSRKRRASERSLLTGIMDRLRGHETGEFDAIAALFLEECEYLQCIFVLDAAGLQVSRTHFKKANQEFVNVLTRPAVPGTNHAMKEYYFMMEHTGAPMHLTAPYMSQATGDLCVTLSARFHAKDGLAYIICLDTNPA
ncbi:MAG: EAL domain-containing protein [Candidatus Hydrogenedentota bacterium]